MGLNHEGTKGTKREEKGERRLFSQYPSAFFFVPFVPSWLMFPVAPIYLGALGGVHGDEGEAGLVGEDGEGGDELQCFQPEEGFVWGAAKGECAMPFEDEGAGAVGEARRARVPELRSARAA